MKLQLLNIFLFALGCLISISAKAHDVAIENEDGVTIYYNFISGQTGLSVTYNDDTPFFKYTGNIKIPASVTIENVAYRVIDIGKNAFTSCKVTSVEIPSSITSIGEGAFKNCTYLTAVYITDMSAWLNIDFFGDLFWSGDRDVPIVSCYSNPLSYAHHLYLNGNEVTELKVPDDVTAIGDYAFFGCTGLTDVQISSSVTTIGKYAFCNCTGLTSCQMPSGTTNNGEHLSLGTGAFRECYRLRSIYLSSTMPPYIAYQDV